jgi:GT2 family glycosyltransferase
MVMTSKIDGSAIGKSKPAVSVVIPTYRREAVLLHTIVHLLELRSAAAEIIIVDQTESHEPSTVNALEGWNGQGMIRWIRLAPPSITHAMNRGLLEARNPVVLFLDDDIIPDPDLVAAHATAHANEPCTIVAGQVLQPGEEVLAGESEKARHSFCSAHRRWADEFIGCNFSVNRQAALELGGFDENFVRVAYRYEAEFSDRALSAGQRILFEPAASIRHLKISSGGTRSYGHHLTTVKPSHAVGAYYYLLRARRTKFRYFHVLGRMLRSIRTKHHLRHPWWIPGTLISEILGFCWAIKLAARGPALLDAAHLPGR